MVSIALTLLLHFSAAADPRCEAVHDAGRCSMRSVQSPDDSKNSVASIDRKALKTSDGKDSAALTLDLVKAAAQVVSQDSQIKMLYVYTSKTHLRLYKRMGIPTKNMVETPEGRDVIIRLTPAELMESLK